MSNSSLVSYTKLSPNYTPGRINYTRITPHCVVGQLTAESIGSVFAPKSRKASSNYGIGRDGKIGQYVDEKNRSWCSSSSANDSRAITIECACDLKHPYSMNGAVWNSLVKLCTDICKRHGKTKLLWLGSKSMALNYSPKSNEMIITAHRWFSNTACPGDWLYSRLGRLAEAVTSNLSGKKSDFVVEETDPIHATGDLVVDGITGHKTIYKWQQIMGTPKDGEITGQKYSLKKFHLGFASSAIEYGGGGSMLVEAVQRTVGLSGDDIDGQLGPITIQQIQRHLGTEPDGYFGKQTASALQERLNTGKF